MKAKFGPKTMGLRQFNGAGELTECSHLASWPSSVLDVVLDLLLTMGEELPHPGTPLPPSLRIM